MKIDFEAETPYGTYRDALHYPDECVLTDEQIAAAKQKRVTDWVAMMDAVANAAPGPEEL